MLKLQALSIHVSGVDYLFLLAMCLFLNRVRIISTLCKALILDFAIPDCHNFNSFWFLFFGHYIIALDDHFCSHLAFNDLLQGTGLHVGLNLLLGQPLVVSPSVLISTHLNHGLSLGLPSRPNHHLLLSLLCLMCG